MTHQLRIAALAVTVAALSGCGNSEPDQAAPAATPAAASPSPSPSPTVAPPASASPGASTPTSDMKLGATRTYAAPTGEKLTVQALRYKAVDGAEAVEARLCNTGTKEFQATRAPWVLLFDGGESEHDVDVSGGGLPAPAYPGSFDPKDLAAGKCVRGWINWEPIEAKKPYGVGYRPDGGGNFTWKF